MPFLFASLVQAVGTRRRTGRAGGAARVPRDPRDHGGTARPEYGKSIDIVTGSALKAMMLPALIPIAFPVIAGIIKPEMLGGLLIGTIVTGIFFAIAMTSGGGAWDNAKKLIEDGLYGRQGPGGARRRRYGRHRGRSLQGHGRPGDQPDDQDRQHRRDPDHPANRLDPRLTLRPGGPAPVRGACGRSALACPRDERRARVQQTGAAAGSTAGTATGARSRYACAVRDCLRKRRLVDLLRARRHRGLCAGLTPLVFVIAGLIFAAATALTYTEGTVRFPSMGRRASRATPSTSSSASEPPGPRCSTTSSRSPSRRSSSCTTSRSSGIRCGRTPGTSSAAPS